MSLHGAFGKRKRALRRVEMMSDSSEYVEEPSPPEVDLNVSSVKKRGTDKRMRADSLRFTSKMCTMSRMRLRSVHPSAVLVSGTT